MDATEMWNYTVWKMSFILTINMVEGWLHVHLESSLAIHSPLWILLNRFVQVVFWWQICQNVKNFENIRWDRVNVKTEEFICKTRPN
jgi:hypothetical protein